MFQDKVYEDMDDISKLVEPIESTVNAALSYMPDEVEVTKEHIQRLHNERWGWHSLNLNSFVDMVIKENDIQISTSLWGHAEKFFRFEVRSLDNELLEEAEQVSINMETGIMSHRLFLVKHTVGYDDQTLESMAKANLTKSIKYDLRSNRDVNKSRLNELADLFGAQDVRSDRAYRGKIKKFCQHIDDLVDNKKLDIRDLGLCEKFSTWVVFYVRDGNLAALNNITRIKIMMHENRPIYSIQERSVR